jgi:hypothetical protein
VPTATPLERTAYFTAVAANKLYREHYARPNDAELKKRAYWAGLKAAKAAQNVGQTWAPPERPGDKNRTAYLAAVAANKLYRDHYARPDDAELKKRAYWAGLKAVQTAQAVGNTWQPPPRPIVAVTPPPEDPAVTAARIQYWKDMAAARAEQAAAAPPPIVAPLPEAPLPEQAPPPADIPPDAVAVVVTREGPVVVPATIHTPVRTTRYGKDARSLWDPVIQRYRVFIPSELVLGSPTFTVSFGAESLPALALAANEAVLQHIRSRADKRPPGRSVPAVKTFQEAERASRGGETGSLVVDGLWGNSSKHATAFYTGRAVGATAPTAFRSLTTWTKPVVTPTATTVIPTETLPTAITVIPTETAPIPEPTPQPTPQRELEAFTPRDAPVDPGPILITSEAAPTPSPTDQAAAERKAYWDELNIRRSAAKATVTHFTNPNVNWGTVAYPNEYLRTQQSIMKGLNPDGIMGELTRARVAALGAGTFPARPRTPAAQLTREPGPVLITTEPQPGERYVETTTMPRETPPTPEVRYVPPVPATEVLTTVPGTPVMVDDYILAHSEPPPRGAIYVDETGSPAVVGMREIAQEPTNPGLPPVGVRTSAPPASSSAGWGWLLAAMVAASV